MRKRFGPIPTIQVSVLAKSSLPAQTSDLSFSQTILEMTSNDESLAAVSYSRSPNSYFWVAPILRNVAGDRGLVKLESIVDIKKGQRLIVI